MKNLKKFLIESSLKSKNDYNKFRLHLKDIMIKYIKDNNIKADYTYRTPRGSRRMEIMTIKCESQEFLESLILNAYKDYNVIIGEFDISRYGSSGKFYSYELTINGEKFFISYDLVKDKNKNVKAIFSDKDLTPDKFGFSGKLFLSEEELIDALSNSSAYNAIKNKSPYVFEFLTNLIIEIDDAIRLGKFKTQGAFNERTVDNFFNSDNASGNLEIYSTYLSNKNPILDNIADRDIAIIGKNFGEILGPYILYKLFNNKPNINLYFPKAINNNTVDYYFNGNLISAKFGKGGTPSGVDAWNTYKTICSEQPGYNNTLTRDELDLIENVMYTYEYEAIVQSAVLIQKFVIENNPQLQQFLQVDFNGITASSNKREHKKELINRINKIYSNFVLSNNEIDYEKIKTWFNDYYTITGYKPDKYPVDDLSNPLNYNDYIRDENLKIGLILYPLFTKMTKAINDRYNDSITSLYNKLTEFKQIHLKFTSNGISLKIVSTERHNREFKGSGIGTSYMTNNKLGIVVKHKD